MQVLLFAGETYYPKKYFEDFVAVLPAAPSSAELAATIKQLQVDRENRLGVGDLDWASVLVIGTSEEPLQYYWVIGHGESQKELTDKDYCDCWVDNEGRWHGVCELKRLPQTELDLEYGCGPSYTKVSK